MLYQAVDLAGKVFGRLTVIDRAGTRGTYATWNCSCACGKSAVVRSNDLKRGTTKSCGCLHAEIIGSVRRTHGDSRGCTRMMLSSAKQRARTGGLPFDLTFENIPDLPKVCPVLGIKLDSSKGKKRAAYNSPSLDRIVPALGYVVGNVRVISWRANQLKSNATPEELRLVAEDSARLALVL